MKLKEYVEGLQNLIKERPEAAEFEVVMSSDDEGNSFSKIGYAPSVGFFDEQSSEFKEESESNSVCVN